MYITRTPLTPQVGLEIAGLSGGEFVDRAVADDCLSNLDRRGVVVYREADLADADLVSFSRMLGEVAVVVNNAGWDRFMPFLETTPELWEKPLRINLFGQIAVAHAFARGMAERGHGVIVNVSSDAGKVGSTGETVYAAAKGGVITFTRSLARELARHGVRVNCVCPGPTDTPFLDVFQSEGGQKVVEAMTRAVPMRRLAQPDEIAAAVAFLASDDARFITGQALSVSGGLTMS